MTTRTPATSEEEDYAALYLSTYAAGHVRGCGQAIPELRRGMTRMPPCRCAELKAEVERERGRR